MRGSTNRVRTRPTHRVRGPPGRAGWVVSACVCLCVLAPLSEVGFAFAPMVCSALLLDGVVCREPSFSTAVHGIQRDTQSYGSAWQ